MTHLGSSDKGLQPGIEIRVAHGEVDGDQSKSSGRWAERVNERHIAVFVSVQHVCDGLRDPDEACGDPVDLLDLEPLNHGTRSP